MTDHVADPSVGTWALRLDDHPLLPGVRQWVRQRLAGLVTNTRLDDILLVVVELVTNAEVHTRSPRSLAISHRHGTVQIDVVDGDPRLPMLRSPSTTRKGGRGVFLVDALATTWGVRRRRRGKVVWAKFGTGAVPEH